MTLCRSAEADGVVTAGGVASWHDLAVYLVARFCGREKAIQTAKVFLISEHPEGQLPYAVMSPSSVVEDGVIRDCQKWVSSNYATANPVEYMVRRSGLSPRTFTRRFRAATGFAPLEYVQAIRIEEAKQILETDDVHIDNVGERVGYEDPASFRRIFKRLVGLPPASYRRKFQRIASIAAPA